MRRITGPNIEMMSLFVLLLLLLLLLLLHNNNNNTVIIIIIISLNGTDEKNDVDVAMLWKREGREEGENNSPQVSSVLPMISTTTTTTTHIR